jgi:hypothetical protein
MNSYFEIELLPDAVDFLDNLDDKTREKSITTHGSPNSSWIVDYLKN